MTEADTLHAFAARFIRGIAPKIIDPTGATGSSIKDDVLDDLADQLAQALTDWLGRQRVGDLARSFTDALSYTPFYDASTRQWGIQDAAGLVTCEPLFATKAEAALMATAYEHGAENYDDALCMIRALHDRNPPRTGSDRTRVTEPPGGPFPVSGPLLDLMSGHEFGHQKAPLADSPARGYHPPMGFTHLEVHSHFTLLGATPRSTRWLNAQPSKASHTWR